MVGVCGWDKQDGSILTHQANAVDCLYKLNPAILCHLLGLED